MSGGRIELISQQDAAVQAALLDLNNAHARETSYLTPEIWHSLVGKAFAATCISQAAGLLIAFDQDADYDGVNFQWFRERLSRFIYVDRIIVSKSHHGRGLAAQMYLDLYARARKAGHDRVVCEVNRVPPNPGSDAFHEKMGFAEVGRATLANTTKTVRYLAKHLEEAKPGQG